jgi:predicted histone-like DNA-binding protein
MSVSYKLVARPNPQDKSVIKVYPVAVSTGKVKMEEICSNIERNSTATRGDVKGIALAFANMLGKALCNGNSVFLEDLGYFRLSCQSEGTDTEKAFTASKIKSVYINFQPTGDIKDLKTSSTFTRAVTTLDESEDDDSSSTGTSNSGSNNNVEELEPIM